MSTVLAIPEEGFRVDELHIRPPTSADMPLIAPAFRDPAVGGEAGLPPLSESELITFQREQLPALRASGFLNPFLIVADGSILGGTTLHHFDEGRMRIEVGYWLLPHARGRGVATRAVRCLADHVFARGVVRLEAVVRTPNDASIRVLERLGFEREGLLRQLLRYGNARADAYLYCLLNDR